MSLITHETPGRYCALMGIPEASDLQPGTDFRKPEYRRAVFLRFYAFHSEWGLHPGGVYFLFPYLAKHYGWDIEQKLWLAFINGNTQHPPTSLLIYRRFPNFADLNLTALDEFSNREWSRLEFDTDRRHQKRDFMASVRRYKQLCGSSQADYFARYVGSTDGIYENFNRLWDVVRKDFYSFGRLSAFSYLEYLRIMGLNLDCPTLFLRDMQGSKSHRNGLAKVLGRDDLDWHDTNSTGFDGKYTPEVLDWLEAEGATLLAEAKQTIPTASYFTLESTLCTFKSWFRPNRRYPGVYLDMLYNRIRKAEQKWPDDDFSVLWLARKDCVPHYLLTEATGSGMTKEKQNHFRLTGQVILMDRMFPCFKNDYQVRAA